MSPATHTGDTPRSASAGMRWRGDAPAPAEFAPSPCASTGAGRVGTTPRGNIMAIDALVTGRLHSAPERRTASSGREFVTCRVRVAVGSEAMLCSVIAFDAQACAALLALEPGESVALAGELTPKLWTPEGRQPRVALDLLAYAALTPYAARKKRRAAGVEVAAKVAESCSPAAKKAAPRGCWGDDEIR